MSSSCRVLRPYLHRTLQRSVRPEHARAYLSFQRRFTQTSTKSSDATNVTHDYEKRVKQLEQAGDLGAHYPLNPRKDDRTTARRVHEVFVGLKNDQVRTDVTVTVLGMCSDSFYNTRRYCRKLSTVWNTTRSTARFKVSFF